MVDQILCPCGSQLRRIRCCGLDFNTLSPPEATAVVLPLLAQAEAAQQANDLMTADRAVRQALELAPGREDALILLYRLCRQQNRPQPAEALIRRVVALNPNNFWATNELTLMLLSKGALAEAELHARNAVRIAPQSPQAHNLMGLVLTEANRPLIGEYHYRRVLELAEGEEPITLANLAWNLKQQGRMEEARALYKTSTKAKPEVLQTVLGWAKLEEADRKFEAALALLDRAEALHPDNPGVHLTRATVLSRQKKTEAALKILDDPELTKSNLGPVELSEKGRLLDRLGHYADAFAAFDAAKKRALELGARAYMAEAATDLARRAQGFFIDRRLATLPKAEMRREMPQPVFIIGFPRSGTTLMEQTLTSHPRIAAGDELPYINDITQIMPRLLASPLNYPEALAELWMGDQRDGLNELRDYYLNRAAKSGIFREGADWFTDKMPLNETHLGLISLLFPAGAAGAPYPPSAGRDGVRPCPTISPTASSAPARSKRSARHYVLIADLVQHYRSEHLALRYLLGPLRGYRGRTRKRPCGACSTSSVSRFRPGGACSSRPKRPLRPHRQLRPGDRETLRPVALPLPALP